MGQYGATRLRLLLFNLATDEDDPVLGFTSAWIRVLAARCASVDVITMRAGRFDLPANVRVRSVGKEKGHSIPRRIGAFYRLLFRMLREERVDACFSHMMPAFTVLGGPVLRARRIPLVTWYAHPSLTRTLKLAHHLSDRMVTSLPTAYPYLKDKLTVVGQGIDTTLFSPGGAEDDPPLVLCVGRLSPTKDHSTLIEAVARLHEAGERFRLAVVGGPATSRDFAYVRELRAQADARGLGAIVHWVGPVAPAALPAWYRRCAVHVNLTPVGFGDKVALEAMSCGRASVVANDDFRETLGSAGPWLTFPPGDAGALAERLRALLALPSSERARLGLDLRARVVEWHGLPRLAGRLIEILREEGARKSAPSA
jgi:glycosyltransferase involved in cell wall biosynthesis